MTKECSLASLLDESEELQTLLEQQTDEWIQAYRSRGGTIHCRAGCSNCCHLAVHCSFPEAVRIARHLPEAFVALLDRYVAEAVKVAGGADSMKGYLAAVRDRLPCCPFLNEDGCCSIYSDRPLSCRSLLSTADPRYCAADLSKLTPGEMDELNAELDEEVSRCPTPHVEISQQLAQQLESMLLVKMSGMAGLSLSGSLPYLVWMERRYNLADILTGSRQETLQFLEENGLNRRFLLDVQ